MGTARDFFAQQSYRPWWLLAVALALPILLAAAFVIWDPIEAPRENARGGEESLKALPWPEREAPITEPGPERTDQLFDVLLSASPLNLFGMLVFSGCFSVSLLVLGVTLPLYLLSEDSGRIKRAGGIAKSCLQFILASGAGLVATLSFS